MRKRWTRDIYIEGGAARYDICSKLDMGDVPGPRDMCDMCGMHGTEEAPLSMVRLGGAMICEHCERALVSADPYAEEYDAVARLLRRAMFNMVIAGA